MNTFVPAQAIHPGEFLSDELEARGMTQEDLADITGISRRQIINLLQGKSGITPDTAVKLSAAFEQDPAIWMHYQGTYELALASKEQRDISRRAKLYEKVPLRELTRRGWLPKTKKLDELEASVCRLLRIPDIDAAPTLQVAARKSTDYASHSPAQLAWYCRVSQLGESAPVAGEYRDPSWTAIVDALRPLTAKADYARRVPATLAELGIRFVVVHHLKGTLTDGVALWLDDASPVVGLSLRHDRVDNFWFTLFHELSHIHHRDECPVDEDVFESCRDKPAIEQVADSDAASALVPPARLESFIAQCDSLFYQSRVVQFANSLGIHPSIVVGQLQHLGHLKYQQFAKFKEKVRRHICGQAITDGWGDGPSADDQ